MCLALVEALLLALVWYILLRWADDESRLPQRYAREVELFRAKHAELAAWYINFEPLSPEFVRMHASLANAGVSGKHKGFMRRVEDPEAMEKWLSRLANAWTNMYTEWYWEGVYKPGTGRPFFIKYGFFVPEKQTGHSGSGLLILSHGRVTGWVGY
ncbi:MAG: hypothetical protein KatS3mg132_631 [Limisphaera sp.]|nr:MAG: hypothetical protein KatS3mg132_631 [Limisphaera sp.]